MATPGRAAGEIWLGAGRPGRGRKRPETTGRKQDFSEAGIRSPSKSQGSGHGEAVAQEPLWSGLEGASGAGPTPGLLEGLSEPVLGGVVFGSIHCSRSGLPAVVGVRADREPRGRSQGWHAAALGRTGWSRDASEGSVLSLGTRWADLPEASLLLQGWGGYACTLAPIPVYPELVALLRRGGVIVNTQSPGRCR